MSFLKDIVKTKKEEVRLLKKNIKTIESSIKQGQKNYFLESITRDKINIIAEVKKASPSTGFLKRELDPIKLVDDYCKNGANSISVVTDSVFFKGELSFIKNIKNNFNIPVLRKDFIIDEAQIIESRHVSADAILLIAKILSVNELKRFIKLADELGMDVIIEVHDEEDIKKALKTENKIIGINNRDLETFEIKLNTSIKLATKIPNDRIKISESGISSIKDVSLLTEIGYNIFLIGTYLITHSEPGKILREIKKVKS
ncbi:MAG TPA: indole-3-glycerol phosphate synthase TrpC [Spirochaetota bacterium]|nr:indole-3-glycerol phosphate synthase TrpC [Spirochaetota bacterium]HOM38800.1 indole-3-glycerol phosphate synthase TrpC [Spirochaetota bacterium]HPQ49858.1 indole-3-glycerol phosphate synthase TrpC [Spirochaetota bacterium]